MSEIKTTFKANVEGRFEKRDASHGRMAVAMMETCWMENLMVREHTSGQMEDKYVGGWKNGQREGLGCHSRYNGFIFIGEFQNNLPHGEGFYVGPDGICYSGTWVSGKQQGKGLLKDQNEE